jgi:hypothetical protein
LLELRQAIALPIYTLALVLEVAATALARRAARSPATTGRDSG